MHQVSAKFVPRVLTSDQKLQWFSIYEHLLQRANDDENLLKNVITGDKTWVYGYDVETKQQSSHWKSPASPCPKRAQQVCSQVKEMPLVFFDHWGIVHYEFTPEGQIIKAFFGWVRCHGRGPKVTMEWCFPWGPFLGSVAVGTPFYLYI
jgi:hypothetical protein